LTLLQGSGVKQLIKKADILKRAEGKLSVMPEGLQAALTLSDFADLISYLETLKENQVKGKSAVATRASTTHPTVAAPRSK
jgi:hypothetical protein